MITLVLIFVRPIFLTVYWGSRMPINVNGKWRQTCDQCKSDTFSNYQTSNLSPFIHTPWNLFCHFISQCNAAWIGNTLDFDWMALKLMNTYVKISQFKIFLNVLTWFKETLCLKGINQLKRSNPIFACLDKNEPIAQEAQRAHTVMPVKGSYTLSRET